MVLSPLISQRIDFAATRHGLASPSLAAAVSAGLQEITAKTLNGQNDECQPRRAAGPVTWEHSVDSRVVGASLVASMPAGDMAFRLGGGPWSGY